MTVFEWVCIVGVILLLLWVAQVIAFRDFSLF